MSVLEKKKKNHKSFISEIWQLTNSLQSIWGKGKVGQETKVPQMSTMFSHQNSNQKKALEPALEPAFYQTRCRLAVLRKFQNTMQDHALSLAELSEFKHSELALTSLSKEILQARALLLLWPGFALHILLGQGKGEEQACTCFASALTAHRLCRLQQLSFSVAVLAREIKNIMLSSFLLHCAVLWYREVFHLACRLQKHDFFKNWVLISSACWELK